MKKLHLAISTQDIEATVKDYSIRLDSEPYLVIPGKYALWRTNALNISVRHYDSIEPGKLRHLGWEDANALSMSAETDVNGIVWENFTAQQQADEIKEIWSSVEYEPE